MSQSLRLLTIVMLSGGGLFTGALAWTSWERVWIWRRLTLRDYAVDFRRSVRKADPAMPILLVICGVAAGAFAARTHGPARVLAFVGAGLLASILVSSIILAEPVNSQFRRHPEGTVPPDAERLRRRWRHFHLARTALAVAALACLVTAATYAAAPLADV